MAAGSRAGEKQHESLMTAAECGRAGARPSGGACPRSGASWIFIVQSTPAAEDFVEELDKEALEVTKKLAKKGLRSTHATCPPIRVDGPYEQPALLLGVDFVCGLKNKAEHIPR